MKVLIYRPLGDHPPGTRSGELLLGVVHSVSEEQAKVSANKGFVIMPAEARGASADVLAAMYEAATKKTVAATVPPHTPPPDEPKPAEAPQSDPAAPVSDQPATSSAPESQQRRKDRG